MSRPSLLYVAPLMPQLAGNGLAMRAGFILRALAAQFDVHLFVVPVSGGSEEPSGFVRQHTVRVGVLPLESAIDPYYMLISRILNPEERFRAQLAYPRPQASAFCTSEGVSRLLNGMAPVHWLPFT